MRLQDKVAIITGAGSGIGNAIALRFAAEGARVALVGRRAGPLRESAEQIGSSALDCPADVTRVDEVKSVVARAVKHFGALHILVNNAAILVPGTAESLTLEDWESTYNTNVRAVWLLSREVLPHLRRAGGGSIINISSVLGSVGARNRVAYASSKGAVNMLTKAMALDHAAEKIRVNCICPGIVETEMVAGFIANAPDPEAARRSRTALHPMGRFGRPEDIAPLAVYLAGDESSWMTGAAIPIDGGYSAI